MTGVEIFFGALTLFSTVQGVQASRGARKASARRSQAESNISRIKQRREKRNQLRQARLKQAEIVAQGVGEGGSVSTPSTSVQGATAGVQSQYAYNLSFLDQVRGQNELAFQASQEENVFKSKARTATAFAGLATTAATFDFTKPKKTS